MSAPRIAPVDPPYAEDVQDAFNKIMPPGVPPLNIFRTYAQHPALLRKVMALGAQLLSHGTLDHRDREVVLHRTCARCGAEYEWGVHVTAFARPLGFTDEQIRATVLGDADDPAWDERQRLLIRLADELHDTSTLSDELWDKLVQRWNTQQLLELISVAGLYHSISYTVNALKISPEESAERFPTA
jgi:alkylhydroperoxidase family enzyme